MSSSLGKLSERLFAITLKREESSVAKSLKQEAEECANNIKLREKPKRKSTSQGARAVLSDAGKRELSKGLDKTSSTIKQAEKDIQEALEKEKGSVPKTPAQRVKTTSPLNERQKIIEAFKKKAAAEPALLLLGLNPEQAKTLDEMLGQVMGNPILTISKSKSRRLAQEGANDLLASIKKHWDAALPQGQSRGEVLKDVFNKLKLAVKEKPDINPSLFVREKLFNPWRVRFMERLGGDEVLVRKLRKEAGLIVNGAGEEGVPSFLIELHFDKRTLLMGLDVDHAEERLSDAVKKLLSPDNKAQSPKELLSVIESDGMQLLTPRENRIVIEKYRNISRDWDEKIAVAAKWNASKKERDQIQQGIDELLKAIDGLPPDTF